MGKEEMRICGSKARKIAGKLLLLLKFVPKKSNISDIEKNHPDLQWNKGR